MTKGYTGKKVRMEGTCKMCGQPKPASNAHYCTNRCASDDRFLDLDGLDDFASHGRRAIKHYLLGLRGHRCEICGRKTWSGQPIPLVMDHIDGHADNNRRDNLRLICANCDALLPTYKSRNRGNGRYARRKRYSEGKSY